MTKPELAEPYLLGVLATAGLDVEYTRGEGNILHHVDADGREIPVVDYVGGYGSLLLGHSHPVISEYAKSLLDAQTPVHAQFSRHSYAQDVATELNRILKRELDTDESFYAIFANSGAEAIEAALKHAELDRVIKVGTLAAQIEANVRAALAAVENGEATFPDGSFEELTSSNAAAFGTPPVFLTPSGAFHGKLVGSVQLTHNEGYRTAFKALAAQARFIAHDEPGALKKVVDEERVTVRDLVVEGGVVRVVERDLPVFCAFVLEPIQGEGGIHELSPDFVDEVHEVCAAIGAPIIVDEIQSGMGRTGKFLAGSHIGLRGDYYALAKSLGGGIAKAAVLLVKESRYQRDFEMVHSSTYAKDSFSCLVALKVLEIVEANDGEVYRLAAERGAKLKAVLEAIKLEYPDEVKEVRGRGLMLGLEFHDQSGSPSEAMRGIAGSGFFGYFVAGHLLREHRVRTFPTSSAVYTLRFEPSVYLTDAEIDQLDIALRDVCELLAKQDGVTLGPIG